MRTFVERLISISGKDSNVEVVLYGLQTMLDGGVSLIILMSMGFYFDKITYTVLYIIFSTLINRSTGGYHAATRLGCGVITMCMFYIAIFIPERLQQYLSIYSFLLGGTISALIVWLLAPVVHPDKPLTIQCFYRNRLSARVFFVLFLLIDLMMYYSYPVLATALWINQVELAMSVLSGWWVYNKK